MIQPDPAWTPPVPRPQNIDHAVANLAHTLDVFGPEWNDDLLVMATSNVYGPGIKTGLSVRDLRIIAEHLAVSA